MQDEPVFVNTQIPLILYDLIQDIRREPDVPKSKGFGSGPYSISLPKDRRLQIIIIAAELGAKLDVVDKHIGGPGRAFVNPHIENAITQFSAETGIPEDDLRKIINRPRQTPPTDNGPAPPPQETLVQGQRDP